MNEYKIRVQITTYRMYSIQTETIIDIVCANSAEKAIKILKNRISHNLSLADHTIKLTDITKI